MIVRISNHKGMPLSALLKSSIARGFTHARATAKFVQCIDGFDAVVTVSRCGETVGGASIMGILTLGAGPGMTITVTTAGAEAAEAMEAIAALVANRFGEDE